MTFLQNTFARAGAVALMMGVVICGMAPAALAGDAIKAAVAADRMDGDADRDAGRKPGDVLHFFGLEPGMQVFDMLSGGGYYTEIVSRAVGADGGVTAYIPPGYLSFVGDAVKARYGEDRLPNVTEVVKQVDALTLEEGSYDLVLLVLGYHDLYLPGNENWPSIDAPRIIGEIYKSLKPGGVFGVIDHDAVKGSGHETGNTVHRIAEAVVLEELTAAGFVLEESSDMLRNADDPRTGSVFGKEIRGKTDRFVLKFRKPD